MDSPPPKSPNQAKALVKYASEEKPVHDFNVLNRNFDLFASPINFMHRRTLCEEIIYRAALAETQRKSPYASFRLALENVDVLDNIGVVVGVRSLKSILSMILSDTPVSLTVHRIGKLILIDEFDVANFVLKAKENEWNLLREILRQKQFSVVKPTSPNEELFRKFLYHCLLNLERVHAAPVIPPKPDDSALEPLQPCEEEPHCFDESPQQQMPEEHARSIVWNLHKDMQLLVGSDLAIFGTTNHPCISLRLQDSSQPINVLTGIDLWLDNMLNEVAEVAMCYHSNGIVEQDFRIIRTDDLPREAGFETSEVKKYLKNVMEFLHRHKLREGRTYWLYKGDDNDVVKLYDLSDLRLLSSPEEQNPNKEAPYPNPFTRPVATLCCMLAESRLARLRNWNESTRRRDVFSEKENFDELAKDALRLLWNCFQCVVPQKDLRLFVRAVQLYQELLQLMRAHGSCEPVLNSARDFDPALPERARRIGAQRNVAAATGVGTEVGADAVAVEVPRYEEVLIESLRETSVSNVVLREACLRGPGENPKKELLEQVIEGMSALLDHRPPSDYLHDRDSIPSANPRQSIPLQMESGRWEEEALAALRETALNLALRNARAGLEAEGDTSQNLEACQSILLWIRIAEFLYDFLPKEKRSAVFKELSQVHPHCVSLLMHLVQKQDMSKRLQALNLPPLSEAQLQLVKLCVTAANPGVTDRKELVAAAIRRITETLISLNRLCEAVQVMLEALETKKAERGKSCMGHRNLAFSYIQTLLLYLQCAIRELSEKAEEHFQENSINANSCIATAVSLARKYDFRTEGAGCLLAQATLCKLAAMRETTANLRHIEAALKVYAKARDLIGSKHNSPSMWTEINRCRLRTVLEVADLRGANVSDAVIIELIGSALDEKCRIDWGSPNSPSFQVFVRTKFEAQSKMISIYHKGLSIHFWKLTIHFPYKKVFAMACDATGLQRRFFEVLNSNLDGINAASAQMAAEAFLSILNELEALFVIVKSRTSGFTVVGLLTAYIFRFYRHEAVLQFERFEAFGGTDDWRKAAAGFCSYLQRAIKQIAQTEVGTKPERGSGKSSKAEKGAEKGAKGAEKGAKGAEKGTKGAEKGAKGAEKGNGYAGQLKDVYRQFLQLQLKAENYALCVKEMCDLLLSHFEGKLV